MTQPTNGDASAARAENTLPVWVSSELEVQTEQQTTPFTEAEESQSSPRQPDMFDTTDKVMTVIPSLRKLAPQAAGFIKKARAPRIIPLTVWGWLRTRFYGTTEKAARLFYLRKSAEEWTKKLQQRISKLQNPTAWENSHNDLEALLDEAQQEYLDIDTTSKHLAELEGKKVAKKQRSVQGRVKFVGKSYKLEGAMDTLKDTIDALQKIRVSRIKSSMDLAGKINSNLQKAKQKTRIWDFTSVQKEQRIKQARNALVDAYRDLATLKEHHLKMSDLVKTADFDIAQLAQPMYKAWVTQDPYAQLKAQFDTVAADFFALDDKDRQLLHDIVHAGSPMTKIPDLVQSHGAVGIAHLWDHLEAQAIVTGDLGREKSELNTNLSIFRSIMQRLKDQNPDDPNSVYNTIHQHRDKTISGVHQSIEAAYILARYPEQSETEILIKRAESYLVRLRMQPDDIQAQAKSSKELNKVGARLRKLQNTIDAQYKEYARNAADKAVYQALLQRITERLDELSPILIQTTQLKEVEAPLRPLHAREIQEIMKHSTSLLKETEAYVDAEDISGARESLLAAYASLNHLTQKIEFLKPALSPKDHQHLRALSEEQWDEYYRIAEQNGLFDLPHGEPEDMNAEALSNYLNCLELNVVANNKKGFWGKFHLLGKRETFKIKHHERFANIQQTRLAESPIAKAFEREAEIYEYMGIAAHLIDQLDDLRLYEKAPVIVSAKMLHTLEQMDKLDKTLLEMAKTSRDKEVLEGLHLHLMPYREKLQHSRDNYVSTLKLDRLSSTKKIFTGTLRRGHDDIERYNDIIKKLGARIIYFKDSLSEPEFEATKKDLMEFLVPVLCDSAVIEKVSKDAEVSEILHHLARAENYPDLWLDYFLDKDAELKWDINLKPQYIAILTQVAQSAVENHNVNLAKKIIAFYNQIDPTFKFMVERELRKDELQKETNTKDSFRNLLYRASLLAAGETEQKLGAAQPFDYAAFLEEMDQHFQRIEVYFQRGKILIESAAIPDFMLESPDIVTDASLLHTTIRKYFEKLGDYVQELNKSIQQAKKAAGQNDLINCELESLKQKVNNLQQQHDNLVKKAYVIDEKDGVYNFLQSLSSQELSRQQDLWNSAKTSKDFEPKLIMLMANLKDRSNFLIDKQSRAEAEKLFSAFSEIIRTHMDSKATDRLFSIIEGPKEIETGTDSVEDDDEMLEQALSAMEKTITSQLQEAQELHQKLDTWDAPPEQNAFGEPLERVLNALIKNVEIAKKNPELAQKLQSKFKDPAIGKLTKETSLSAVIRERVRLPFPENIKALKSLKTDYNWHDLPFEIAKALRYTQMRLLCGNINNLDLAVSDIQLLMDLAESPQLLFTESEERKQFAEAMHAPGGFDNFYRRMAAEKYPQLFEGERGKIIPSVMPAGDIPDATVEQAQAEADQKVEAQDVQQLGSFHKESSNLRRSLYRAMGNAFKSKDDERFAHLQQAIESLSKLRAHMIKHDMVSSKSATHFKKQAEELLKINPKTEEYIKSFCKKGPTKAMESLKGKYQKSPKRIISLAKAVRILQFQIVCETVKDTGLSIKNVDILTGYLEAFKTTLSAEEASAIDAAMRLPDKFDLYYKRAIEMHQIEGQVGAIEAQLNKAEFAGKNLSRDYNAANTAGKKQLKEALTNAEANYEELQRQLKDLEKQLTQARAQVPS